MVRFDSIAREFRESRPLNELVNVHCAVDEHTFLTKGGQLLTVLRLNRVDHECLDHPQLDNVARRFEAALRSLTLRRGCQWVAVTGEGHLPPVRIDQPQGGKISMSAVLERTQSFSFTGPVNSALSMNGAVVKVTPSPMAS